jgi:hypothetical protein
MCRHPDSAEPCEEEADHRPSPCQNSSSRWHREFWSWWKVVRVALQAGELIAVARNHEALAGAARALIMVGDGIAEAGRH